MKSEVKPEDVPEVLEFLASEEAIQELKKRYAHVFEALEALVERRNTALQAADKAVRGQLVSCGPFELLHVSTRYNPEKLFDELGEDSFQAVGGTFKTVRTFEIDRPTLEAYIKRGSIPQEVLDATRTRTPNYKKPEPYKVP